jgi:hypothetical protein
MTDRKKTGHPKIPYPTEMLLKNEDEIKTFISRTALQIMLMKFFKLKGNNTKDNFLIPKDPKEL